MNIRDLEYLVALSQHKHFRYAAEECNVSQPTLSGQIKKLENTLGVSLLERTSRKVLFTESGMTLVTQCKKILYEVNVLKQMATFQSSEMTGKIHAGLIPTLGPFLLSLIAPGIATRYPDLQFFLYEGKTKKILEKLEIGQIDFAIVAATPETEDYISLPLFYEQMYLVVSKDHFWGNKQEVSLSDLRGKELLMLGAGNCLRNNILDYCLDLGVKENKQYNVYSLDMLYNLVSNNFGITLLPKLIFLNKKDFSGKIHFIKIKDPAPFRQIVLIYRPGSPLKDHFKKIADLVIDYVKPHLG